MRVITFNTNGHDDFVDFLKAYAIICVLFGHTFMWLDKVGYCVWAGMQVPLFILIQTFHTYKKEIFKINLKRILQRVLLPFVVIEILTFGLSIAFLGYGCNDLIYKGINGGGYGPGAYYPWIYLQVALLLPLFGLLLKKYSKITSLVLFLIICEGLEVLFSLVDFPDTVYRVICVRYIFLFYLGWLWVKEGIRINGFTIVLSILSLASIIYFEYISINDEPWFYATCWKYHRWLCYYFVSNGLVAFLYFVWNGIRKNDRIKRMVGIVSNASYEIFLLQMMLIFILKRDCFSFIPNGIVQYSVWLLVVWGCSIIGGVMLSNTVKKITH